MEQYHDVIVIGGGIHVLEKLIEFIESFLH